jgi:hypothetical protein
MEPNSSGSGKNALLPEGVKGWSWGAFLLNWIWGIFNHTYIALLALIPYVNLLVMIVVGIKGREWAWRNKKWESLEHFKKIQRRWDILGLSIVGFAILAVVAAITISTLEHSK